MGPNREAVNLQLKLAVLILLLVGVSIGVFRIIKEQDLPEITYSRFLRELDGDQVERVYVKGLSVVGYGKDSRRFRVRLPYLDAQLADDIATHAEATFTDEGVPWDKILVFALPALVLGVSLGLWMNASFSTRPRNPSLPS